MVWKVVQNVEFDFKEFVDDNANVDDNDYDFAYVGQGNRFSPNR